MLSQPSEEPWTTAPDIFKKHLSCREEAEPRRVADRAGGGVAAVGVLLILILSLAHRAGEVIKIVQLGMALATKSL